MTTCKQCSKSVADDAPTCPSCGTVAPGEGGAERDAETQARSAKTEKQVMLGCGGFVVLVILLIAGGAAYTALTTDEASQRDASADAACAAVTDRKLAADFSPESFQATMRIFSRAAASDSTGLADVIESQRPTDGAVIERQVAAVDAWCDDHPESRR